MRSWKLLAHGVTLSATSIYDEWLSTPFWWDVATNAIGPMFSKQRALELYNQGLQFVRSAWMEERSSMCSAEEAE
jgi:hypothetical protein